MAEPFAPEELELLLEQEPENVSARLSLIEYYGLYIFRRDLQLLRNDHILFMIANHPEVSSGWINEIKFPQAFEEGKKLWMSIINKHPDDGSLLWNAARFASSNRTLSAELCRRGTVLEPSNVRWHSCLAFLSGWNWYEEEGEEKRQRVAIQTLAAYERAFAKAEDNQTRYKLMTEITKFATRAGEYEKAIDGSVALLKATSTVAGMIFEGYGVHFAYIALGAHSLERRDVRVAKSFLAAAVAVDAQFPAGLVLGPDFGLAASLLRLGESREVLDYLVGCKTLWPNHLDIEGWMKRIENGEHPSFRETLVAS